MTGKTHSKFFSDLVEVIGGVPAHFSIDGAPAWNGVEAQLRYVFGDTKAATVLVIEKEVCFCFGHLEFIKLFMASSKI